MDTSIFKTRSEIIPRKMPKINGNNQYKGRTVVALDGGYSAVKGASPERVFIYPSFAKPVPAGFEIIGNVDDTHIMFKDNSTQKVWLIGQAAENLMDQSDLDSITDTNIYTRYRYDSPMYKALMATGLGLGLIGTPEGNEVFLQTGLPSEYKKKDAPKLVAALSGDYDISIKIGSKQWHRFKFSLDAAHISVMEQPHGTLCAVAYKNGELTDFGVKVMAANSMVLDVGFGTEDIFPIQKGDKAISKTFSDTAMKAVFNEVISRVKDENEDMDSDIKIYELQNYLESGEIPYFDISNFKMNYIPFGDILDEANRELCEKSILRLMEEYQNMKKFSYLIVTGGTGESRFEQIKQKLSVLRTLTVVPGNINTPDLSCTYSNVIGYYMLRYASLMRDMKKATT